MMYFLFLCNLLIPIIMIIVGRMMWKHCPAGINWVIGYRTKRSMKNMETWNFAHEYCGRLWWKIGWITLILSALAQLPFLNGNDEQLGILSVILCTVQCVLLIIPIFPTEAALKRTFKDN